MVAFCSCFRKKRSLLREAEDALGRTRDPNEIVDMLLVIEKAAPHFYLWAELGSTLGRGSRRRLTKTIGKRRGWLRWPHHIGTPSYRP
jgi:hypothetical protein